MASFDENIPVLHRIELVEDETNPDRDSGRVAWIRRLKVHNRYGDGNSSRDYRLDVVSHRGIDAVGVIPYWIAEGQTYVFLLRCFRPALAFRPIQPEKTPFLIEVVAGVLEDGEHDIDGVRQRAVAETREEAGFTVNESDIVMLGEPFFSSPGVFTEKLWLCAVPVNPAEREEPTRDGSVMEDLLAPRPMALTEALQQCRQGAIRDAKTEIALERFARWLNTGSEVQQ